MQHLRSIWNDESGSVVSAELVTIGTMVTVGAVVGWQEVSTAINAELRDVTKAIRSLDQSYSYRGFSGCNSMTAGSAFMDPNSQAPPLAPKPAEMSVPPKTSDATSTVPELETGFLSESDESPADDESLATSADDKL